jgi:transcriptional regulator with XRE-family HTH domain
MTLNIKTGLTMRDIRKKKKISAKEMASHLGFDSSQVSRMERGLLRVNLIQVEKFCEVVKISPSRFFGKVFKQI